MPAKTKHPGLSPQQASKEVPEEIQEQMDGHEKRARDNQATCALVAKDGPLEKIWMAAHWEKRLKRQEWTSVDVVSAVKHVENIESLRMCGHLLLGCVKVQNRKMDFLDKDTMETLQKMRMSHMNIDDSKDKKQCSDLAANNDEKFNLEAFSGRELDIEIGGSENTLPMQNTKSRATYMARPEDITISDRGAAFAALERGEGLKNDVVGDLEEMFGPAGTDFLTSAPAQAAPASAESTTDFFKNLTKDFTPLIPVLDISPAETTISIDALRNADIMLRPSATGVKDNLMNALDAASGLKADGSMIMPTPSLLGNDMDTTGLDTSMQPPDFDMNMDIDMGAPEDFGDDMALNKRAGDPLTNKKVKKPRVVKNSIVLDDVTSIDRIEMDEDGYQRTNKNEFRIALPQWASNLAVATPFINMGGVLKDYQKASAYGINPEWGNARKKHATEKDVFGNDVFGDFGNDDAFGVDPNDEFGQVDFIDEMGLIDPIIGNSPAPASPKHDDEEPAGMSSLNLQDPGDDDECGVGYSTRTKKMEDWLAGMFKKHGDTLSYLQLAEQDPHNSTLHLAGCFFELLVLKTHGVIDVIQGEAFSEITVKKGAKWHAD